MAAAPRRKEQNMKITDLKIDPRSIGARPLLVEVLPSYAYSEGKRTNNITGYRYVITMPDHSFDKLSVRVDGKQQLDAPDDGYAEVAFQDLEIYTYWTRDGYQVGARAKGVKLAGNSGNTKG